MSTRHLITRVREHLNLADLRESAIIILSCPTGSNLHVQYRINFFTISRKCNSDYEAKIHEACL